MAVLILGITVVRSVAGYLILVAALLITRLDTSVGEVASLTCLGSG